MMKLFMILGVALLVAGSAWGQTADLMISEYVEGSGDNQALEIYNGTADIVNLGGYTIERYANGATVSSSSIALPALNLAVGHVFVVVNALASPDLLAHGNMTHADLVFSGNDALVLADSGLAVDSIGRVGEDPGNFWSCSFGTTQNHTLTRLPSVCSGDTVLNDPFDPCLEWTFDPVDTFTGLGSHSDNCGSVPDQATSWGALKATFR